MTNNEPKVIHEDQDILVLDKPSGLVVNVSSTTRNPTLQEWVREKYPMDYEGEDDSDFYGREGIVHRLDKETSGIILVARNKEAFDNLQEQFKSRSVGKEYIALVFGVLEDEVLEINAPIDRNPKSRTKMAVVEGGRPSTTRIERIKVLGEGEARMTLIKAFPKTGRTHQIRVHLAALGFPVIGDDLYAGKKRSVSSREEFGRLMLHARKISFTHPRTGELVSFEAPTPTDFDL